MLRCMPCPFHAVLCSACGMRMGPATRLENTTGDIASRKDCIEHSCVQQGACGQSTTCAWLRRRSSSRSRWPAQRRQRTRPQMCRWSMRLELAGRRWLRSGAALRRRPGRARRRSTRRMLPRWRRCATTSLCAAPSPGVLACSCPSRALCSTAWLHWGLAGGVVTFLGSGCGCLARLHAP